MSTRPTDQDGPPVADLAEAVAHLRNVAQYPGRMIRYGSAAQLVLDAVRELAQRYAVIEVKSGENGWAFPVVERDVQGGWQSGAHHYPDAAVIAVQPILPPAVVAALDGEATE